LLAFSPAQAADGQELSFLQSMEFGGHLHSIGIYHEKTPQQGNTDSRSDIQVNSVELGLASSPRPYMDTNIVWLLEEPTNGGSAGQSFAVDQAFVTLSATPRMLREHDQRDDMDGPPVYAQVGKFYAPFATRINYHTFDVVSEPPTLALGETLESGLRLGYRPENFHVFGGVFGGPGTHGGDINDANNNDAVDAGEAQNEQLDDFYAGVGVDGALGQITVQWMSNLNSSIALQNELNLTEDGEPTDRAEEANAGVNVYARTGTGPLTLQGSYVAVQEDYERGAMAGHQPAAATGELTYRANDTWQATAVYHYTDDWPGHAERGVGGVIGARLAPGLSLAGQVLHREHDSGLSNTDSENLAAVLLDAEFGAVFGPLVRRSTSAID
jgi:hypothetical protein